MIRCFMDATIDSNSECAYCCIHCKKECDCRCEVSKQCKTEDEILASGCCNAYEE